MRGCLWAIGASLLAGGSAAALYFWGGIVGHALLAAAGMAVAGFFVSFFGAEPHSHNQERFMLYFGFVLAIGGAIAGVWLVVTGGTPPWWVYGLGVLVFMVSGAWLAHWLHKRD